VDQTDSGFSFAVLRQKLEASGYETVRLLEYALVVGAVGAGDGPRMGHDGDIGGHPDSDL
jgi:hypothetical protein